MKPVRKISLAFFGGGSINKPNSMPYAEFQELFSGNVSQKNILKMIRAKTFGMEMHRFSSI
jgi:hypothetical protein